MYIKYGADPYLQKRKDTHNTLFGEQPPWNSLHTVLSY